MAKGGTKSTIGSWAFLIGVVIAVIIGLFVSEIGALMGWTLVILGLIVGLLNITEKEVQSFLMAGTILVIVSKFGGELLGTIAGMGILLQVTNALLLLFVPATVIVALKHVFTLARG